MCMLLLEAGLLGTTSLVVPRWRLSTMATPDDNAQHWRTQHWVNSKVSLPPFNCRSDPRRQSNLPRLHTVPFEYPKPHSRQVEILRSEKSPTKIAPSISVLFFIY
ncbi:hypothetical protein B0J13DRAFT_547294 [Dactylonectria estremocensis]|uniref:Secreted protein n=1 Tax=Dactylonectria estremocensis TaxID=1079267 RepID=A0A9P9JCD0_9HYPO|nr:hypothetical protein B0J13DRAFT_547294 [Dactylonectria estremocensis]